MIRTATVNDLDQVLELLKHFAAASLIDYKSWDKADVDHARVQLLNMIRHHYLLVAEHDNKLIGMIGAVKEPDFWFPKRTRLRELFWWVEPAFRKGRLSAELYIRWEQAVESFLERGLVDQVSLSTQPGFSDIDPAHRGWICVEKHWIKG